MTGSVYLSAVDLAPFGVPTATRAQIMQASALIDSELKRPDGCVWVPDAAGNPCYMQARAPMITYRAQSPIAPGNAVSVSIPGLIGDDSLNGEVLILDAANPNAVEACTVKGYTDGVLILQSVTYAHSAPCTMDRGLVITEENEMPNERSILRLSQWPIMRLLSGVGRYGYARRSDQMQGFYDDINLLAIYATFGGAPQWEPFDIRAASMNPRTGEVWIPAGFLLANYTNVKLRYVGGWSAAALPSAIKTACANIIRALVAAPAGPAVRRFTAGKVTVERFSDQVIDDDTRGMLRDYRATTLG